MFVRCLFHIKLPFGFPLVPLVQSMKHASSTSPAHRSIHTPTLSCLSGTLANELGRPARSYSSTRHSPSSPAPSPSVAACRKAARVGFDREMTASGAKVRLLIRVHC